MPRAHPSAILGAPEPSRAPSPTARGVRWTTLPCRSCERARGAAVRCVTAWVGARCRDAHVAAARLSHAPHGSLGLGESAARRAGLQWYLRLADMEISIHTVHSAHAHTSTHARTSTSTHAHTSTSTHAHTPPHTRARARTWASSRLRWALGALGISGHGPVPVGAVLEHPRRVVHAQAGAEPRGVQRVLHLLQGLQIHRHDTR